MITDNNEYLIKYGKHKGRRFVVAPLLKFEFVALKVIKRSMRHGGQL
jgi:hypothetical protein